MPAVNLRRGRGRSDVLPFAATLRYHVRRECARGGATGNKRMAILVSCSGCGKQFRAKDQFRNTRLKCPACKAEVLVAGPHVCGTDVFISHTSHDKQVAD